LRRQAREGEHPCSDTSHLNPNTTKNIIHLQSRSYSTPASTQSRTYFATSFPSLELIVSFALGMVSTLRWMSCCISSGHIYHTEMHQQRPLLFLSGFRGMINSPKLFAARKPGGPPRCTYPRAHLHRASTSHRTARRDPLSDRKGCAPELAEHAYPAQQRRARYHGEVHSWTFDWDR